MLTQLLTNQNDNNTESNDNEEEHDAEVIKGIQAQIAAPAQRDKLKKVVMTRP